MKEIRLIFHDDTYKEIYDAAVTRMVVGGIGGPVDAFVALVLSAIDKEREELIISKALLSMAEKYLH